MVDTEGGILEASLMESDRVFQELDMQVAAGTLYWGEVCLEKDTQEEVFPAETWAFLEEDTWVEVCSAVDTRVKAYSAEDRWVEDFPAVV